MGFDTKYRPLSYDDVLGQETTIKILKQYVKSGKGFQQSYIFSGSYGTGKTTLGRIFARSLLCDAALITGEPCNKCDICKAIIDGNSDCFFEIDAATNSGKEDIKEIIEKIQYKSFSGKKKIFLFDECHQLSKGALDALLKPMEDSESGTLDKKLVCIFCTTEIEKMRNTIISRCAPTFFIQQVTVDEVSNRLFLVCEKENIKCEKEALNTIVEHTNFHIRDALKTLEAVSVFGEINTENTNKCLNIDLNNNFLDLLSSLKEDISKAIDISKTLLKRVPAGFCYEKLSEISFLCFSIKNNYSPEITKYYNKEKINSIISKYSGNELLHFSKTFSEKPHKCNEVHFLIEISSMKTQAHEDRIVYVEKPVPEDRKVVEVTKLLEQRKERVDSIPVDEKSLDTKDVVNKDRMTMNNIYLPKEAINPNMLNKKSVVNSTPSKKPFVLSRNDKQSPQGENSSNFYSKIIRERFEELCRESPNTKKTKS